MAENVKPEIGGQYLNRDGDVVEAYAEMENLTFVSREKDKSTYPVRTCDGMEWGCENMGGDLVALSPTEASR